MKKKSYKTKKFDLNKIRVSKLNNLSEIKGGGFTIPTQNTDPGTGSYFNCTSEIGNCDQFETHISG